MLLQLGMEVGDEVFSIHVGNSEVAFWVVWVFCGVEGWEYVFGLLSQLAFEGFVVEVEP